MGYIDESQAIVTNSERLLNKIFASQFTQFVQGLGQPVLVEWYNYNALLSNTQQGTVDVDHLIGLESPIRYNYIPNMPVYGINQNLVPELTQLDGNLYDMNMELDVIVLPNTFRPLPFDHVIYRFGEYQKRCVLFRVNNVQISSIRNENYYRVSLHMVDIDSDELLLGLQRQVVKRMTIDLNRVGTNDNCIIENAVYEKCRDVDKLIRDLIEEYRSFFYSEKYNSVLFQEQEGRASYDPYLNNFIINTHMLESNRNAITMVVHDQDVTFREEYNATLWRALELGSVKYISENLYWEPTPFTRNTMNPFSYYGVDYVYKVHVYQNKEKAVDSLWEYQQYPFIHYLNKRISDGLPVIEESIVKYFLNPEAAQQLFDDLRLDYIQKLKLEYTKYYYEMIPIAVFLLRKYHKSLRDAG